MSGDIVSLTALIDNTVHGRDLQTEHGLAYCIRTSQHRVLFDTGQSDLLLKNAGVLGVSLNSVEAVVISHGHYDHTGGVSAVRRTAPSSRIFVHPGALNPKFAGVAGNSGESTSIGMSESHVQLILKSERVCWTKQPTEVVDGIFVTGEIPRLTSFEDTGGRFFLDENCLQPDPLIDDQAVYFDTAGGLVVLLGCCHAGLVNTVEYIRQITRDRPVYAVLGGLHLINAREERLQETVAAIKRWNLRHIFAGHCTGLAALTRLWAEFPDRCSPWATGSCVRFHR